MPASNMIKFSMMEILEGKTLSAEILAKVKKDAGKFLEKKGRAPSLRIINYYDNSASSVYMKLKIKKAAEIGIDARELRPDISRGKEGFLKLLEECAADENIDAVMVERPLPEGFDDWLFWKKMPAHKDPDCLSADNNSRLYLSKNFKEIENGDFFSPCTALAAVSLARRYGLSFKGKKTAVVGRSAVVGRPLAHMLSCLDSTVTLCHSKTEDIGFHLKSADYIFLAIGKAKWLKKEMIGEGQVIIDIGTNFDENSKMCGDADYEDLKNSVKAISPVPGGVGPITLALLLEASVKAALRRCP